MTAIGLISRRAVQCHSDPPGPAVYSYRQILLHPVRLLVLRVNIKLTKANSMEFVRLMPFNPIPMRSLSAEQTSEMLKVAAQKPVERRARSECRLGVLSVLSSSRTVVDWRAKLNYSNLPKLNAWNWQINQTLAPVQGRVLPTPKVNYGGNKPAQIKNG